MLAYIDVVKLFEKYKLMILNSFSLDGKAALVTGTSDFVNGQILYVDGGILAYISKQLK